ncbi:PREDICTED: trypsin-7-like [Vollenhovia emeryi]|uniref:trypsin-7-like n=1 Tax=Vollenhovia emeryi TaxID=411798 RepID=UPI0005F4095F|nr:PREDICTED: trypsin-7-like [Vollenhovia emeryi]
MSVTMKSSTTAVMLIILCLALTAVASDLDIHQVSPRFPKIIGGTPTTIDRHPYQVSIHYKGEFICGGSIISNEWILTGAHCVYGTKLQFLRLRVGSTYYNQNGVLIPQIASVIIHNKFDKNTLDYDVALIRLPKPLSLGARIKIIILALSGSNVKAGSKATVVGWGRTSPNGPPSKQLQSLVVPVVDQATCQKIFAPKPVTANMICAGDLTRDRDTCEGDSGGALVHNSVQIGIVSWGDKCTSGYPGVYTRVSAIRQWITEQANV